MEEKGRFIIQPLGAILDPALRAEAEAVLRGALVGRETVAVSGVIPLSVRNKLRDLPEQPVQLRLRGVEAMLEWLAFRWARSKEEPQGQHTDTFARFLDSVITPKLKERLQRHARLMGIPVLAYPQNFTARKAGVILPLYALRSEEDEGIGDLSGLSKFIDWSADHGFGEVYLLPIFEIDWVDPSPYLTLSQFGANVLYIALRDVPEIKNSKRAQLELKRHHSTIARLRGEERVDYPDVINMKFNVLKAAFAYFQEKIYGVDTERTRAFDEFRRRRMHWLQPYADFRSIAEHYIKGWRDFPPALRDRDRAALEKWRREKADRIEFFEYVQFLFQEQWEPIRLKAHQRGIRLRGDMPTGVDGDAAWVYRDAFDPSASLGAQPDRYSVVGQNWGGETYDWPAQRAKGFPLLMTRIFRLMDLFDCVRGDYWIGYVRSFNIAREFDERRYRKENLNDLHDTLRTAWDQKFFPEPFPLIRVNTWSEFEKRIRDAVREIEQAAQGLDDKEKQKAQVIHEKAEEAIRNRRHTWAPDEPRYQTPALFLTDGVYSDLKEPDLQIWIRTLIQFLEAQWRPGPGHDLMQAVLQWITYEHLGDLAPEDYGDGFGDVDRARQELGLPRVRPLLFGLSGWGPYWDTLNTRQYTFHNGQGYEYHPNTQTYTTTHDGPTDLGELLDLIQGDPKTGRLPDPGRVQWLQEALAREGIQIPFGTRETAQERALKLHDGLMLKSDRSRGLTVLWMYQDLFSLDNRYRSTPPGDAMGEKWRDRFPVPLTVEALQENRGKQAQRANRLVTRLMEDPEAARRPKTVLPGPLPRVLGMLPQNGRENGTRVRQIRYVGDAVQSYAIVVPASDQTSPGREPRMEMALWSLDENREQARTAPMRFHSVLPDGAYLYYGELPAIRAGEFVLMTRVADSQREWHWFSTEYEQEPLVIIRPYRDFPDPVKTMLREIESQARPEEAAFRVGERLLEASGPTGGAPRFLAVEKAGDAFLLKLDVPGGPRFLVVDLDPLTGGVFFEDHTAELTARGSRVEQGSEITLTLPWSTAPLTGNGAVHRPDIDIEVSWHQPEIRISWGPDTPPFEVYPIQPAQSGMEEFERMVSFRIGPELYTGSGLKAESRHTVPNVYSGDVLLLEVQAPQGTQRYFLQADSNSGDVALIEGGSFGFLPGDSPVQQEERYQARVPRNFKASWVKQGRIEAFQLNVSYNPDAGLVLSWGPDTPEFRIRQTAAASGIEEMVLPRLASSILHYRYGRRELSPQQQFNQSTLARELVRILQTSLPEAGYPAFARLIRQMVELTEKKDLTELLGSDDEWKNNMPPSIVTADLIRIFSDLLRFRWDLRDRLYTHLVEIAVLSQDRSPQEMKLAVDILRGAEIGEIVITAIQSNFSGSTGGLGLYIRELTKGLAKFGGNITVAVPLWQDQKERVMREFFPRNTGLKVSVPFLNRDGQIERAVGPIYEARTEEGVRVIFLEQDRYLSSLQQVYAAKDDLKLRVARFLSLGVLLAIRELKIHPSVLQTNDDFTSLVAMYLRDGEPKNPGEEDHRGDDIDLSIRFWDDPALNGTQVLHVIHALAPGYNLTIYPDPKDRNALIHHDLGRDPKRRNVQIISHPKNPAAISSLREGIVHADHVLTPGQGQLEDSIDPPFSELFDGFDRDLRDKRDHGAYTAIPNQLDTVAAQERYFAGTFLDRSFLEMGVERERREQAGRLFREVTPLRKRALQQVAGLAVQDNAFIYSALSRVERTKGHHILTAPIWKRKPFSPNDEISWKLRYYQKDHDGFQEGPNPFENAEPVDLSEQEHDKLIAYADKTGVDTLSALEVALVLLNRLQVVIAGTAQENNGGTGPKISAQLRGIADRFGRPDGGRHFVYLPRTVSSADPLYGEIYTGSTVFGQPSESETFGLAVLEAFAGGVPVLHSRRGGLRDMEIRFQEIQTGFAPYDPVSWFQALRHFYNVHEGNPRLWDEFRYWAIAERDFRGQARAYRNLYRWLYQRRMHGGIIPDVHRDVELPVLEMASAINQAKASGQPHPADELKKEVFTWQDGVDAMIKGLQQSQNPAFADAVIERYLPELAKIPDPKVFEYLRTRVEQMLREDRPDWVRARFQQAHARLFGQTAGSEENFRNLVPSNVRAQTVHVLDPANADVGLFLGKIQRDPVVILAAGAEEERALRRSGFAGENRMILLVSSFDSIGQARSAAAALFHAYSPRFYPEEERSKLMLWLAWVLERYNVTQLTVKQAAAIVEAMSVLEAA